MRLIRRDMSHAQRQQERRSVSGSSSGITTDEVTLDCNRPSVNNTSYDGTQGLNGTGTCTYGPCGTAGWAAGLSTR